nr:hypothetical protein [Tanacetum cinerariifolium]
EKFERKFTDSATIVQQMGVEVANLKAKLEKYEAEAVEVKVSALELVSGELDDKVSQLTADCDGLRS